MSYYDSKKLGSIVGTLDSVLDTPHFRILFRERNPKIGMGAEGKGVRDRTTIDTYARALEHLYKYMVGPSMNRRPPKVDPQIGRTLVYVFDVPELIPGINDPFMSLNPYPDGIPFICLPCRNCESTRGLEDRRLEADALHEATHVFNWSLAPMNGMLSRQWRGFDEGTAVFLEHLLLPDNPGWLRFALNWCTDPHLSLDDDSASYEFCMFVKYLYNRFGVRLLSQLWLNAKANDVPFEVLRRELRKMDPRVELVDCARPDVFGSGYCMDSYFVTDKASSLHCPEIYDRFGGRALTQSAILKPGTIVSSDVKTLNHLACRYYRFWIEEDLATARFKVTFSKSRCLKAEIALVSGERSTKLSTKVLNHFTGSLEGQWDGIRKHDVDHCVLVVSNCSLSSSDDGIDFRVFAEGI